MRAGERVKYTSGFVRQRFDRKEQPWMGTLKYKDEAGNYHQISKMFDPASIKSRRSANSALNVWRNEMEQQAEAEARAADEASQKAIKGHALDVESITVSEYVRMFIDNLRARQTIEPSTVADYLNTLKHLAQGEAPISDILLPDLRRADVERWEAGLLENGLSTTVVGKAHRLLRECMRRAVAIDDLAKDPTLGIKPPKRTTTQPNALDAAGRGRLVGILDQMEPTPLKVGIALAFYAGMRQGEVCGLQWKNVDLDAGTLWVREAIGKAEGGTYIKTPKTSSSSRDIPISAMLAKILRDRRAAMMDECSEHSAIFSKDLYVLGDGLGRYYNPTTLGHEWTTLAKQYNLIGLTGRRIKFHDLRHTFATAAVEAGVDIKSLASILGHANAAETLNIYASADPKAKKAAIEDIDKAMSQDVIDTNVLEFKTGTAGE